MKKRLALIIVGILLIVSIILGVLIFSKDSKPTNTPPKQEEKAETELLLGFESLEEILGARVYLSNLFGRTNINTDKKYITEGDSSWFIQPNVDNKYFRFQCADSTFGTDDFSNYDAIMMDIYNASDEEAKIQWKFSMLNPDMEYEETPTSTFVLEPNAWTTCTFDLSAVDYNMYFLPDTVGYMRVAFIDGNGESENVPYKLYVDNLRGHLAATIPERAEVSYDVTEGITFEPAEERYAFTYSQANGMQRTSYEEIGIEPQDETHGDYCLELDAKGKIWPRYVLDVGQTFETDMILKYKIYVKAEAQLDEDATYLIEAKATRTGSAKSQSLPELYQLKFNEWIEVETYLPAGESILSSYVNLEYPRGTGKARFASDVPVYIYLDNFQASAPGEGVYLQDRTVENADGSVTLYESYNGDNAVWYTFNKGVKVGQNYLVTVEFEESQQAWVGVFGIKDGKEKQIFADNTKNKVFSINWPAKEDWDALRVMVAFRDDTIDYTKKVVTLKNFAIRDADKTTVASDGTVTVANLDGNATADYTYNTPVKKGGWYTVKVDIKEPQQVWLGVFGRKDGVEKEIFADNTNKGTYIINWQAKADWDSLRVMVAFRDANVDWSKNVVTFSEFKVTEPDITKVDGDTVTLINKDENNYVEYKYEKGVKAGGWYSVKVALPEADSRGTWIGVFGVNGNTEKQIFADNAFGTSYTVKYQAKDDYEALKVMVKNFNETDWGEVTVTLTDFHVTEPDETTIEDGTVTIVNKDENNYVEYIYDAGVKADGWYSVKVALSEADSRGTWIGVFGVNGNTEKQIFADNTTGTSYTVKYQAKDDYESLKVMVKNFNETDWGEVTVTLTNFHVTEPDETTIEDGTVTIVNKDENNYVEYIYDTGVKAGGWYSVKVALSEADSRGTWIGVFGVNGNTEKQIFADNTTGTSYTVRYQSKDHYEKLKVLVKNFNETDWGEVTVTLTDFKVTDPDITTVSNDGTITLENKDGNNQVRYVFNESIKTGDNIKFDLSIMPAGQKANFWILGNDGSVWENEWYGDGVNIYDSTRNFTVTAKNTTDVFTILVQFESTEVDLSQNVVTIQNFSIEETQEKYDFSQGVSLEKAVDLGAFAKGNYGELTTVTYESAGIIPLNSTFGATALKAVNSSANLWPRLAITLDKEYAAGSIFRVWLYVQAEGATASNTYWSEFWTTDNSDYSSEAGKPFNTWVLYEVRLSRATSVANLRLNLERAGLSNNAITVYMDNFQITENPSYSFADGVTFEKAGEFTPFINKAGYHSISLASYDSAGIEPKDSTFGEVALLGNNQNAQDYPRVQFTLDKEYPTGTKFSVWVYVKSDVATDLNKYLLQAWSKTYDPSTTVINQSGNAFNSWVYFEGTLKENTNIADFRVDLSGSGLSDKNVKVYMDNFQLEE